MGKWLAKFSDHPFADRTDKPDILPPAPVCRECRFDFLASGRKKLLPQRSAHRQRRVFPHRQTGTAADVGLAIGFADRPRLRISVDGVSSPRLALKPSLSREEQQPPKTLSKRERSPLRPLLNQL